MAGTIKSTIICLALYIFDIDLHTCRVYEDKQGQDNLEQPSSIAKSLYEIWSSNREQKRAVLLLGFLRRNHQGSHNSQRAKRHCIVERQQREISATAKGDINPWLFCSMLCSDPKLDLHYFKDILDEAIAAVACPPAVPLIDGVLVIQRNVRSQRLKFIKNWQGTIPKQNHKFFKTEEVRPRKQSEDLCAVIYQHTDERRNRFHSMFSSLVSKYGGGGPISEPTEEEFEAAKKKLESRKASKKSPGGSGLYILKALCSEIYFL